MHRETHPVSEVHGKYVLELMRATITWMERLRPVTSG